MTTIEQKPIDVYLATALTAYEQTLTAEGGSFWKNSPVSTDVATGEAKLSVKIENFTYGGSLKG